MSTNLINLFYRTAFLFRITNDMGSSSSGDFLAPFEINAWISIIFSSVLVIISLKISGIGERIIHRAKENNSFSLQCLNTLAAFCQQGIEPVSQYASMRICVITLMFSSLMLYNYYTSSVVGGLLSSAPKGPTTIRQLIDSPLIISFEDIGFHKILFRESNDSLIKELYNKKMLNSRDGITVPLMYTTVQNAIPFIKRGRFAFHCEVTGSYPMIAKEFDAKDVCDLRTLFGLIKDSGSYIMMIQPKRHQYTEMFKIGMIKVQSFGFIKKALKEYRAQKPICQSTSTVNAVSLAGVDTAMYLLLLGSVVALVILGIELFYERIKFFIQNLNLTRRVL